MQTFELMPTNGRKSFGGKARVIIQNNKASLLSYDSIICELDLESKNLSMLYAEKLSNTTSAHLKSFKQFYNLNN